MALTGANTNSGVTTINAGTLQLGIGGTSGSLGAGGVTNNATLAFNRSDAFSVANVISGTGVVQQIGNGTTTLTGANTYSGGTQALAGKLIVGNGTSTGNNLGSGPLTISSGAAVESKTVYGMGGYTGTITNAGTLTLGTYALVKSPLVLNAGTVEVSGSPYDGNYQGAQLFEKTTVQANALPSIIKNITGAGTNFGVHLRSTGSEFEIADGAAAVDLEVSVSLVNQSGDLGVAPGVLTKTGPGTMALTGANTYSGGTTINAGALQLTGSGSLLDTGMVNLGASGSVFEIAGITSASEKIGAFSAVAGSTLKLGSKTLEFGTATDTIFAGNIDSSAGGGITKAGSGKLTLDTTATFTAAPNINIAAGTLLTSSANLIPNTSALTLSGGTLNTGGFSDTVGSLSLLSSSVIDLGAGASIFTFADSSGQSWSGLLSIWNWSGSLTGSGADQLNFLSAGLSGTQLSNVRFVDPAGLPAGTYGATFIGNELVPVPEPTALGMTGLMLILVCSRRRPFASRRNSSIAL
jgi:autotransporter-associated beta strand protein